MNILIVEDNEYLAQHIKKNFLIFGFAHRVKILLSYQDFLHLRETLRAFDIIILDINLGDKSNTGLSILRYIRQKHEMLPVIIISNYDSCEMLDRAFYLGAHDYLIKPFRTRELHIRIQRWFRNYIFSQYYSTRHVLQYYDMTYDISAHQFYYKNAEIILSKGNKYVLFLCLVYRESLLSYDFLSEKIWGYSESEIQKNVRIKFMRLKKILANYDIHTWIENIPGEGYIFRKTKN